MVRKEDLGLTLSLSNCGENRHPLQLNIMPPSASSSSSCPSSSILQKSYWCGTVSSSELYRGEPRTLLRGIDVNRMPSSVDCEEEVGVSSPNSTVSSVSGKRCERETNGEEVNEIERACSHGISDEEDGDICRKKLRLSKDQSAILEESFKEHNTLNPKQKLTLAKQLNLRPRQVEVWFQNRRARTKLKQTEVDCEFLKRCCENLTEQNRRLKKEVQELRALKLSPQIYMQMTPPTTLTTCPSCDRVAVSTSSTGATTTVAGDAQHRHLSGTHLHRPLPFNPWVAAAALNPRPFDAPPSRS